MALDESALSELLGALRAGDGVELIRDAVRLVMQELIELEAFVSTSNAVAVAVQHRQCQGHG